MQDTLSQAFSALADPTRRSMLERLSRNPASVSDLAEPYLKQMSLPAVTKHLKVLEKAGFISKTVDAQFRRCRIKEDAFRDVADWMEEYRVYWEESFDRLEEYLKTVAPPKKSKSLDGAKTNPAKPSPGDARTPPGTRKGTQKAKTSPPNKAIAAGRNDERSNSAPKRRKKNADKSKTK